MVEPAVVLDGPFRYAAAGCEIRVSTPARDRDLWHEYLDGALANYLRYGVESVLEYKTVRPGRTTTMFFAAVDPSGTVIGGMRVQGPYSDPGQAHALTEWAGRPERRSFATRSRAESGLIPAETARVSSR